MADSFAAGGAASEQGCGVFLMLSVIVLFAVLPCGEILAYFHP